MSKHFGLVSSPQFAKVFFHKKNIKTGHVQVQSNNMMAVFYINKQGSMKSNPAINLYTSHQPVKLVNQSPPHSISSALFRDTQYACGQPQQIPIWESRIGTTELSGSTDIPAMRTLTCDLFTIQDNTKCSSYCFRETQSKGSKGKTFLLHHGS